MFEDFEELVTYNWDHPDPSNLIGETIQYLKWWIGNYPKVHLRIINSDYTGMYPSDYDFNRLNIVIDSYNSIIRSYYG